MSDNTAIGQQGCVAKLVQGRISLITFNGFLSLRITQQTMESGHRIERFLLLSGFRRTKFRKVVNDDEKIILVSSRRFVFLF